MDGHEIHTDRWGVSKIIRVDLCESVAQSSL